MPSTWKLDTLQGGTDTKSLVALRQKINKNQYAATHGGLRIFVCGPGDNAWRAVVNAVLHEAQWFSSKRGYMMAVIPLKDSNATSTTIHFYDM